MQEECLPVSTFSAMKKKGSLLKMDSKKPSLTRLASESKEKARKKEQPKNTSSGNKMTTTAYSFVPDFIDAETAYTVKVRAELQGKEGEME